MSDLPVGVWYLGAALCFGAAFLLFRGDAAKYRRQWIAAGGTSGSWWIHVGCRFAIALLITVAVVTVLKSPVGERFGHLVQRLLR